MSEFEKAKSFLIPKARAVFHFLLKQGTAMTANLIYGLLCVRLLPKPDYAKFAVVFGFMGSLTVLLDIGISGTIAPLVGEQIENLQLIANYLASIRQLLLRLYLILAPFIVIGFIFLVERQHWGASVVTQMIAVLLVTAWIARVSASYSSVLILRRDRGNYYRAQIIGSCGSLTLLALFWYFHHLNLYVGILLNVAQITFIATYYFIRANQLLGVKGVASKQQQKAVMRLATPNFPNAIFYAIQGQITLMLITIFGHSANSVANVGALGRLGQILVFFSQMNPILVEPFFAKLPAAKLKRIYIWSVSAIIVAASCFSTFAFLYPEVFLYILGPKYNQLRVEVGLMILSSSISYVSGFIWIIHSARRFVYWWNNIAYISLTLIVQILFIWKFDLSTVRNVLLLNVCSASAALLVYFACGIYGFWHGPQTMDRGGPEQDSPTDLPNAQVEAQSDTETDTPDQLTTAT